jgi:uncharacterized protein YpuA (DUF1002 family)
MAIGTTPTTPATSTMRGTQRETFAVSITPVDEKRFESEIRRMDAVLSEEKKNREKFETRIEKAVNDLHGEMNVRFEKMEKNVDARFEKMEKNINERFDKADTRMSRLEDRLWWIFGAIILSILLPLAKEYL